MTICVINDLELRSQCCPELFLYKKKFKQENLPGTGVGTSQSWITSRRTSGHVFTFPETHILGSGPMGAPKAKKMEFYNPATWTLCK